MNVDQKHTGTSREKRDKESARRELLSKYLYDVSKLFVAGMVLINIMPIIRGEMFMFNVSAFVLGLVASITFAWMANRVMIY